MSFFEDLGGIITGSTSRQFTQDQLKQQLGFGTQVLDQQTKEAELKYNPVLQAEKNKMYIAIAVIVGIIAIVIIKKFV